MTALAYFNPYSGLNFFGVMAQLLSRLGQLVVGSAENHLYSDELQILVLMGVALSSSLVGTFLILRRMAMLANALSHTVLLGIVVAFIATGTHQGLQLVPTMLAALSMGVITTFLTQLLTRATRLQEDASVGLVFTSLFSMGIVAVTVWTRNAHIGTEAVMGNVDALHAADLKLVAVVAAVNIILIWMFFKEYTITTFDAGLASALGISTVFFDYLLMVQAAATSIGAFRAVGVLMVLAFLTGPALSARLLTHRLSHLLVLACAFGMSAALFGVAISRHLLSVYGLAMSTAGITVVVIVLQFLAVLTYTRTRMVLARSA